jgi:hypothetical protein
VADGEEQAGSSVDALGWQTEGHVVEAAVVGRSVGRGGGRRRLVAGSSGGRRRGAWSRRLRSSGGCYSPLDLVIWEEGDWDPEKGIGESEYSFFFAE